ncbi:quinone-dependent dihydroorotate dehydrogenase [Halovenus sp. WSH3]|uniref:Dihydroorotate dehydrogenase (quinone) n=1 Tax=Halovenus carboxidivorans TaxID=2692199 RepID=A0A6B0T1R5_9EURY|nr:quinone-dependent dihydroorotate dehydrogenase [Halovenus carboxidivorans]MXR51915.1 quinone-dependent dihydroorotate dehydrogenase [Halovenus carboxidivorans]
MIYDIAKPLFFRLPPETAHGLVHRSLEMYQQTPLRSVVRDRYRVESERLQTTVFGQQFPNPVGVAAGFDKNAEIAPALGSLGFGFVEVGGVTASPQTGNPRPRMFRLPEDRGLINRMGLNNDGAAVIGERLDRLDTDFPVGVNIAKSEDVDPEDAPGDYRETYEQVASGGDFFVVNISCPNSQGFAELQNRDSMAAIIETLQTAGAAPLLVKLSPDLPEPAVDDALSIVEEFDLDGVVATNTTTDRPASLRSPARVEGGGLSGEPIKARSTEMVRYVAQRVDVPVVGVGGISSAEDAYQKIRAGARVVQLYTGLVYEGPSLARKINRGLLELLDRDGFESVEAAVGADL